MPDSKLTGLSTISSVGADDLLYIVDVDGVGYTSKKTTVDSLRSYVLSTSAPALRGYLAGLNLSLSSLTVPTRLFTVAPGCANDNTNDYLINLPSSLRKNAGQVWVAGADGGSLDQDYNPDISYSALDSVGYYVFLIANPTSGAVDILTSRSATAPTMPSGYTRKRRIGWLGYDTNAIKPFVQVGDAIYFFTKVLAIETTLGTTPTDYDLNTTTGAFPGPNASVPDAYPVTLLANIRVSHASSNAIVLVNNTNTHDIYHSVEHGQISAVVPGVYSYASVAVPTTATGQITATSSHSSTSFRLYIVGFIDRRGQDDYL